jgi:hypothetical protein
MAESGAKLLAKVADKIDRVLFEGDLEFADESRWEEFLERLQALVYDFYDDHAEEDSSFDPDKSSETSSSQTESVSLEEVQQVAKKSKTAK